MLMNRRTYISAKYELFLIILTTLPKLIITRRNPDNQCLQAHDLHTNYTQLHAEITVAVYDYTTLVMTQNPRDVYDSKLY